MPTCVIDGRKVEFAPGENLVEVAKKAGVTIPVFCYHPAMTVVAQCRMCAVTVEGMPKLQTACSTQAKDGMVVNTQSEASKKNRSSVMEFLLINHPLDCPICDKSGECDLQDFSYGYGSAYMRYTEERRTYLDLDMGPVIQKNMNRCIHCTRCIRFGDEIAGIREMVAVQRGNNTEISTVNGRPLETEYAGNYADVCPTGSLTLKNFRFNKRVWMLKKTPTVCEGCSRGCNMEAHWDNNVIYRCVPRTNMQVNKHWLCDEGRFNFNYVHDARRVIEPKVREGAGLAPAAWTDAIEAARKELAGKKALALLGSDLTNEEARAAQEFVKKFMPGAAVHHFGTPGVVSAKDDGDADKILRRKSRTSNLHGLEKLGITGFEKVPAGVQAALVIRGGRAVVPSLKGIASIVGMGVFNDDKLEGFQVVLPGAAFAEKSGTIVNSAGMEQRLNRAVAPPGKSKMIPEILMLWGHGGAGASTGAA